MRDEFLDELNAARGGRAGKKYKYTDADYVDANMGVSDPAWGDGQLRGIELERFLADQLWATEQDIEMIYSAMTNLINSIGGRQTQPTKPRGEPKIERYARSADNIIPETDLEARTPPPTKVVKNPYSGPCPDCGGRHALGIHRTCGTIHCFAKGTKAICPSDRVGPPVTRVDGVAGKDKDPPAAQKDVKQTQTPYKSLGQDHLMSLYRINYTGMNDFSSVGIKVFADVNGTRSPFFMCCRHQAMGTTSYIEHQGKRFGIPAVSSAEWVDYPPNGDVGLLPWTYFKGGLPNPPVTFKLSKFEPGHEYTFLGLKPGSGEPFFSGLTQTEYVGRSGKLYYRISTENGVCGSPVIMSHNGSIFVVSIHAGTEMSGDLPNYGYTVDPSLIASKN